MKGKIPERNRHDEDKAEVTPFGSEGSDLITSPNFQMPVMCMKELAGSGIKNNEYFSFRLAKWSDFFGLGCTRQFVTEAIPLEDNLSRGWSSNDPQQVPCLFLSLPWSHF
jgi:hypothetical protein